MKLGVSQSYLSMEWPSVKFLFWALLLFVQIHEHKACIEDERMGLLELKTFLKSKTNHTKPLLPTWVNDTKSECCSWERVKCSTSTGHVIKLTLASINQEQNYEDLWYINMSLFQPFKELRNLDLSDNKIAGWLGNEESNCLSKMSKLAHLNLSWNYFDKEILRSLDALPVLKSLDLSNNYMEGPLSSHESNCLSKMSKLGHLNLSWNYFDKEILRILGALPVLKFLDLSFNDMEGPLSSHELAYLSNLKVLILAGNGLNGSLPFKDMANFSSLEILDLSRNEFTGSITPYIGALSSLKAISLSYNIGLNGTLITLEFCALNQLEEIDLAGNGFEGMLPPCLNNLTSLSHLDISGNRLNGNLSSSPIVSLTSLEYIDLSYNLFEGLFSFSLFANHSKLKVIQFLSDNNKLDIETENHSWDPLFQLKVLVLSNCNLNNNNFPKFLLDQHELEAVDISHSKLNGSFPIWLLENNTGLQLLNLHSNFFTGHFHLSSNHSMNLRWLDVSDNHFDGQLQQNIGKMIPKLEYLNLSQNHFDGKLPASIGDMSNLWALDFSFNNFFGEVPVESIANCTSLDALRLSDNNFQGEFFSKYFNFTLFSLELQNNRFTSALPMVPLKVWAILNISNNHMTGTIPLWMVNQSTELVDLSSNVFEGQIPCGLATSYIINLSHNLLSGWLPSCLNPQAVRHLLLQGNKLTGSLPKAILNSSSLMTLDIRDNSFIGSIPDGIDGLSKLKALSLSGNNFSGMISRHLCQLKGIDIMDLSKNSFSGTIPHCLHNISFGKLAADDFSNPYIFYFSSAGFSFPYKSLLNRGFQIQGSSFGFYEQIEIEIMTKYRLDLYKGHILNLMSVLDLSFNKLTGEIPLEFGQLSSMHSLNLSHNQLIGPIPKTFSNLTQLESLDLSHNNLSGKIPSTLIDMNSLAVFNVSYNNLSGKLPDFKAQFGTFEKSSYEENPFLCGPPLEKSCTEIDESPPSPQKSSKTSDGKWYQVDLLVFSTSFSVSYVIFFLGVASVLYINSHWRQQCFNLIEDRIYWCSYFALNTLKRLLNRMCC